MTRSPGPSRQSAYAQARDCQGGGLFPLDPPPPAAGGELSTVGEAEPAQVEQQDADWNIDPIGIGLMPHPPKPCRRLPGRVEGQLQPVRGQDDRKRERHARDGVWLPAGER